MLGILTTTEHLCDQLVQAIYVLYVHRGVAGGIGQYSTVSNSTCVRSMRYRCRVCLDANRGHTVNTSDCDSVFDVTSFRDCDNDGL